MVSDVKNSFAHHMETGLSGTVQTHDPEADGEPIFSRFIDDEVYRPLLVEFSAELPGHIHEINVAVLARNAAESCRLGHKMKGASATYGYPELSVLAGTIESDLSACIKGKTAPDWPHLATMAEDMVRVCRRIAHGIRLRGGATPLQ